MKTFFPKKETITRKWWLVDAEGKTLGRLASEIAVLLRGKKKVDYCDHLDSGDFVVVINAEKVRVTGKKMDQKKYYSYSGYPGGIKEKALKEMLAKKPEEVIKKAVWGMIPKNRLGRKIYKKLKVYRGSEHPHQAQNPQEYQI
ncbi:MAG: 50S ribosomal protein L13 [Candidatus Aminicenantes bacterium 4484_214]|nr:MAG: 50S ribosomal protein L13 [Candidatus Aminicenantes bacterium 4484_214]RLE09308.1 MAG: 50S ribosomal protein L13 [Candidatus Aminicenantes bacterium]HDJ23290.1 50S ribosomal protein L13 [Candidatus Aminicenantes bacterium]